MSRYDAARLTSRVALAILRWGRCRIRRACIPPNRGARIERLTQLHAGALALSQGHAETAGRHAANCRRVIYGAPLKFTAYQRKQWLDGAADVYRESGHAFPQCLASRRSRLHGWAVFAWAYGVHIARGESPAESRRQGHATRREFWRGYAAAMLGLGGSTTYRSARAARAFGGSWQLGVHCLREDAVAMALAGARDMQWDAPGKSILVNA